MNDFESWGEEGLHDDVRDDYSTFFTLVIDPRECIVPCTIVTFLFWPMKGARSRSQLLIWYSGSEALRPPCRLYI